MQKSKLPAGLPNGVTEKVMKENISAVPNRRKLIVVGIGLAATFLLACGASLQAQTANNNGDLVKRVREIEDRMALKELVDTFSILADKKDVRAQTQLFTPDGTVETYRKDVLVTKLAGRKAMEETFAAFLQRFETVYHFNGQQTVTIDGDKAFGTSYCLVTLIGVEDGKRMKTTIGVYYQDQYVRDNNRWLIAKRKSVFDWEDKQELSR